MRPLYHHFMGEADVSSASCVTCEHPVLIRNFQKRILFTKQLLNLRSSVKKQGCEQLLAPLCTQSSGLCLLWLASRITELYLKRKRKMLAAVLLAGVSADKLNCWNLEINEDVRIIYSECYTNGIIRYVTDEVVAGAVPTAYVTLQVKRSYNSSTEEKKKNTYRLLNSVNEIRM